MSRSALVSFSICLLVLAVTTLAPASALAAGPPRSTKYMWVVTTVANVGTCLEDGASLALNDRDEPSISYLVLYDTPAQVAGLWYAHWEMDGWVSELVDQGNAHGMYSSLALDSRQRPHISYRSGDAKFLKYAFWDGNQWQVEPVGLQGWSSSLALDQQDRPHITYLGSFQRPSYAVRADAGWKTEAIEPVFTSSSIPLALDADGRPHVSYVSGLDLHYAYHDGTDWSIETVDAGITTTVSSGPIGAYSALELDDQGNPHISYSQYFVDSYAGPKPAALYYAVRPTAAWITETVSPVKETGYFSSLALDKDGQPHISYWETNIPDLRYTEWNGTSWETEIVDDRVNLQGPTSLKLDSKGLPHIAYCTGNEMRYAHAVELNSKSYLPILTGHMRSVSPSEIQAIWQRCDPNQYMTSVQGTTYQGALPTSGYKVVVSFDPEGPILVTVQSGPHGGHEDWSDGYYQFILNSSGPFEGVWFLWIVDRDGNRISESIPVHTDANFSVGMCQQAVVDFAH